MNPSQPVGSQIQSVSFGYLSPAEIRSLSARRITSSNTFDTLLNPVPGGLYTPELGPFGDNLCATCGLKNPRCPGHPGHIELPVPCYHPTFIDQILRLLRASCSYCAKLKMSRVDVSRFVCKLSLVKFGLLEALDEADGLSLRTNQTAEDAAPSEDESDKETDAKAARDLYERFYQQKIKQAKKEGRLEVVRTEAVNNARRMIIADFMKSITKFKKCPNCGGVSSPYRKDRAVKIFRVPLAEKDRVAMVQGGFKAKDPMMELRKKLRAEKRRKRKRDAEADEGVADLDMSSPDEDGEEIDASETSDEEPAIAGGNLLDEAMEGRSASKAKQLLKEEYLNPQRVHAHLSQLFEHDSEVLNLVYGGEKAKSDVSADMFFLQALLVPPNRFRPEALTGNGEVAEAMENSTYKSIITACETLTRIRLELANKTATDQSRYRARTYADFENTWLSLQEHVNSLIDSGLSPVQGRAAVRNPDGIKQKLEKKEGMFRKYMMGKRVNFAARTVISPDPNIETNEIGVPPVFAVKLTYPEPVTQWNVEELQEAVRNGPFIWPGAVAIEGETGSIINLERKNAEERTALANQLLAPSSTSRGSRPKKVHRHLNNGDIVIMNRQPTLHKPSMMCHRARVLPGEKTLRMHYANCNTYNADFDGDEMNMHFPQNELARAEALSIADTDHQYLSGTFGKPLRGLIQDHISICVWLTSRDMFFERGDYMNLLYAALRPENGHCASGRLVTLPPAFLKPKALWTGKQVVSTVLKNLTPQGAQGLTMVGKSTTDGKLWGEEGSQENVVIFKDGELMQGILDKKQIGPSAGGLVNSVYEAYGHSIAGKLLSVLGRLLTKLLHMRAFSCGVEDLIFSAKGEEDRKQALAGADALGLEVAAKYVSMGDQTPKSDDRELRRRLEDVLRDDNKQMGLDQYTNNSTKNLSSSVSSRCMPAGLAKPFPKNQMQTMTNSGAKGSSVNVNLISCNLGQQVLEGRRVPVMVSGKTLPCFKPFESSIRAGGYIVDRFLTGIRPQEYFFHAMAGREGLIDTAVKTSRSGYLQRCVVKGLEGLKVEHDTTVRDTADGSIIQFLYGEDGLDVGKSRYLSDFKFTAENYLSLFQSFALGADFSALISDEAKEHNRHAEKKYRKTGDLGVMDPALAHYPPSRYAGSISENVLAASRKYIEDNPDRLIKVKKQDGKGHGTLSKKNFNSILDMRYLKAVVEAGEAVGVIAGQSIGEPSTQMTLNTFHLAGHSAKNVTLGIPRLREIVMTAAKNVATPTMTLTLNDGISMEDAKKFAKGISRLSLAEITDKVTVTEKVGKGVGYPEAKSYEIYLEFFPAEEYTKEYAILKEDVIATIERRLLPKLQAMVAKELGKKGKLKKKSGTANIDALEIGKSAGTIEQETSRPAAEREGGDDDSDGEGDDDATRDKAKSNKQQAGYDAYEDDEETDIRKQNQARDSSPEPDNEDEAYGGSQRSSVEPEDGGKAGGAYLAQLREKRIMSDRETNDIVKFSFDDATAASCRFTMEYDSTTPKILMLHFVESALSKALIQSVSGVASCMVDELAMKEALEQKMKKNKAPKETIEEALKNMTDHIPAIIAVSGVNIPAMWEYQHVVHPHHIQSNSINDYLVHYGVEAARAAIVKELQAVFGGHSIDVDPRHLMLIADYMTRDGAYQAFSRMGYRGNVSPFMKMSFETTLGFLKEAVISGDWDDLKNPSARIVAGRLGKMGTGSFDVYTPVSNQNLDMDDDSDEESAADDDEERVADDDEDVEMEEAV